jgi:hypothetical protein
MREKYLALFPMSQTPEKWPVLAMYGWLNGRLWNIHHETCDDSAALDHIAQLAAMYGEQCYWFYPDAPLIADMVPRAELEAAQADAEALSRLAIRYDIVHASDAIHPATTPLADLRKRIAELEKGISDAGHMLDAFSLDVPESLDAAVKILRKAYDGEKARQS